MAAAITHVAFYAGWPKAWAVFRLAKDVWNEGTPALTEKEKYQNTVFFPIGQPNDGFAQYFVGQSYLAPISATQVPIYNVTFEPGCRNNWHVHYADKAGGQMLICVGGRGYYQEWGKEPIEMKPGDCGMVQPRTAGSAILPWKSPVKTPARNGWSPLPMRFIRR